MIFMYRSYFFLFLFLISDLTLAMELEVGKPNFQKPVTSESQIIKSKKWVSPEKMGFYVFYPDCFETKSSRDALGTGEIFKFSATDRCPKSMQGKWNIEIGHRSTHKNTVHDELPAKLYKSEIILNGIKIELLERDDLTATHFPVWVAFPECGSVKVDVNYFRDKTVPPNLELHQMPPVLKDFLSGFKCEK